MIHITIKIKDPVLLSIFFLLLVSPFFIFLLHSGRTKHFSSAVHQKKHHRRRENGAMMPWVFLFLSELIYFFIVSPDFRHDRGEPPSVLSRILPPNIIILL